MLEVINMALNIMIVVAYTAAAFACGMWYSAHKAAQRAKLEAELSEKTLLELLREEVIPGMAKAGAPEAAIVRAQEEADRLEKHIKEEHGKDIK